MAFSDNVNMIDTLSSASARASSGYGDMRMEL